MTQDIFQQHINSSTTLGEDLKSQLSEVQEQIHYYEQRELEHKELEQSMRNSYASLVRDLEEKNKALALAEIRNQELKTESIHEKAALQSKIDLLLNERQEYMKLGQVFFELQTHQIGIIEHIKNRYKHIKICVDLDNRIVRMVMGFKE